MEAIVEENGFKFSLHGKSLVVSTQIGNTWKSCTLSDAKLQELKRHLKSFELSPVMKGVQQKLKEILLNGQMRPSKAMFEVDFERSKQIVHVQELLTYIYDTLCNYDASNNKKLLKT